MCYVPVLDVSQMVSVFKCCSKPFAHYVCTQCNGVLHKTCVVSGKLKTKIRRLGNNKIICCNTGIGKDNSLSIVEDQKSLLEETISELYLETELKNKHIDRLKQDHATFLNEASLREEELNKIIRDNESLIMSLRAEISELETALGEYRRKTNTTRSTQTKIEYRNSSVMTEPDLSPKKLLTSAFKEVSGTVNSELQCEATFADAPLVVGQNTVVAKDNNIISTATNIMDKIVSTPDRLELRKLASTNSLKQQRVLVLTDDFGHHVNHILRNKLSESDYNVECFYKPGASYENVIGDLEKITKGYTNRDNIVIIAGSNNFDNVIKFPKIRNILNKIELCPQTNFIFVGVPYCACPNINKSIYNFNKKLYSLIYKLNICMPNYFSFVDVNVGVNRIRKSRLSTMICDTILSHRCSLPKNLIFVKATQNTPLELDLDTNSSKLLPEANTSPACESILATQTVANKTIIQNTTNFLYPRLSQMPLD